MALGIDLRAQIDTETFKGLMLVNGGGAVALLALLNPVISRPEEHLFGYWIMAGIALMALGAGLAVVHNYYRRQCSLAYENNEPRGFSMFGQPLREPRVCKTGWNCLIASVLCFFAAATVVTVGGFLTAIPH